MHTIVAGDVANDAEAIFQRWQSQFFHYLALKSGQKRLLVRKQRQHENIWLLRRKNMIFGILTEMAASTICTVLGLLIWKKQRISLLHEYHYRNVKKEDIAAYTREIGAGLIIIGIGIFLTALLELLHSSFWWAPLFSGFFFGLIVMCRAQKKYNGSLMS